MSLLIFFPFQLSLDFKWIAWIRLDEFQWYLTIYMGILRARLWLNERRKKSMMIEERKMMHSRDEIKQPFWWSTPLYYGSRLHIIKEKHSYWLDYFMKSRNRILSAEISIDFAAPISECIFFMTFIPDFLYLCVVQLYVAIYYRFLANQFNSIIDWSALMILSQEDHHKAFFFHSLKVKASFEVHTVFVFPTQFFFPLQIKVSAREIVFS